MSALNIKKLSYLFVPLMVIIMVISCKKLENDALNTDESNIPQAPLEIKVINNDDQQPVAGVKVLISRQTSSNGDYVHVDTIRTDGNGIIKTKLPYPNRIRLEIDTTYYHKAEQVLDFVGANGNNMVLLTTPKFGMAPLNIAVTDQSNTAIANFALLIATKAPGSANYISTGGTEHVGTDGKLIVSLPYPNTVRVLVADTIKYFPDTLMAALKNVRGESLALKAKEKPTTVPLEVTVVDKDNNAVLAGIEVAVLHRPTGQTNFTSINLIGTTNSDGKITFNTPFEGEVKIKTTDEVYFYPDSVITRMAYEKNRKITLRSKKLIPKAPVEIAVYDQSNNQILPGVTVKVSSKLNGETSFTADTVAAADEDGKLKVRVRFSGEMKFEVLNDRYFADKTITQQNIGSTTKQVSLPLTLKTAAYPEPILTDLRVSSLTLNNGITLNAPTDVATDKRGNIYICDQNNNRIVRVSRTGNTTVLAGSGTASSVDGVGTAATLNRPKGMVLNDAGTELYVTEYSGHKVRKIIIDLTKMIGTVSTLAGSGSAGAADGVGTAATFSNPHGLALDEIGDALYITDNSNSASAGRLRKIVLTTSTVSTLGSTTMYKPISIAMNPARTFLYIGAIGNGYGSTDSYLFRVVPNTGVRTVLRQIVVANFNDPSGIYISPGGVIFLSNEKGHTISTVATEVTTNSTFNFLAGSGSTAATTVDAETGISGNIDGTAVNARFNKPGGIKYNMYSGNFFIADQGNNKIRIMKSSTIN